MGWSFVRGIVEVDPLGRTPAETRYVLETVLNHLPIIPGSERNCQIHIMPSHSFLMYGCCDEFGVDLMLNRERKEDYIKARNIYMLVLEGDLRHTDFQKTYRRVVKWLCRLAKRVHILDVLLKVEDTSRQKIRIITNQNEYWGSLYENGGPTDEDMNWCQYLLPVSKLNEMPALLAYKYYGENVELAEMIADKCKKERER